MVAGGLNESVHALCVSSGISACMIICEEIRTRVKMESDLRREGELEWNTNLHTNIHGSKVGLVRGYSQCIEVLSSVLLIFMQHPGWLRHTTEVVQKGFKERYKWWAAVELGRRMLLLLFIVPFPGNDVSN